MAKSMHKTCKKGDNMTNRMILYTKDVMLITGKSERTARRICSRIRRQNNKPARSMITVEEFCQFMGLTVTYVVEFLK
jgi:hypothetical protein